MLHFWQIARHFVNDNEIELCVSFEILHKTKKKALHNVFKMLEAPTDVTKVKHFGCLLKTTFECEFATNFQYIFSTNLRTFSLA